MSLSKPAFSYQIINNPNMREMNTVRITKGKYAGVEYAYGNLKFEEIKGEPIVRYVFEVYQNPNKLNLDEDRDFKDLISQVLDDILKQTFTSD